MTLSTKKLEAWREYDLNPPPGYTPVLELTGRKRRLEAGRYLAEQGEIDLPQEPKKACALLFNLYYDALITKAPGSDQLDTIAQQRIREKLRSK